MKTHSQLPLLTFSLSLFVSQIQKTLSTCILEAFSVDPKLLSAKTFLFYALKFGVEPFKASKMIKKKRRKEKSDVQ